MPVNKEAEHLKNAQAAAIAGITVRHIYQLIDRGDGPEKTEHGKIPCKQFGAWLARRTLRAAGVGDDDELDYQTQRARLTKLQADNEQLKLLERKRELLDSTEVETAWSELLATFRARMLALPSRVAPKAVATDDMRKVEEFVKKEVNAALRELAEYRIERLELDESE